MLSLPTLIFFLAGWSSTSFFSTIGATRVLTMLFGYEVPLFLSVLSPALLAGSWRLAEIARFYQQKPLLILPNLLGFVVALIAVQAKLERTPFDIPHAETEVVGGTFTEYSGKKLAFFRLMTDIEMVVSAGLLAAVFLAGFPGGALLGFAELRRQDAVRHLPPLPDAGPDLADPGRPGRFLRLEGTWRRWPSSSFSSSS